MLFDFLYKMICCGYSFELPRLVEAVQMSTHNIWFYKEVDKSRRAIIWSLGNCLTVHLKEYVRLLGRIPYMVWVLIRRASLGGSDECAVRLETKSCKFNPCRGRQHSFVEIDREIFSAVILSLPLIQEGQLSVSGERMCTILINCLEDKHAQ